MRLMAQYGFSDPDNPFDHIQLQLVPEDVERDGDGRGGGFTSLESRSSLLQHIISSLRLIDVLDIPVATPCVLPEFAASVLVASLPLETLFLLAQNPSSFVRAALIASDRHRLRMKNAMERISSSIQSVGYI